MCSILSNGSRACHQLSRNAVLALCRWLRPSGRSHAASFAPRRACVSGDRLSRRGRQAERHRAALDWCALVGARGAPYETAGRRRHDAAPSRYPVRRFCWLLRVGTPDPRAGA